MAEWKWDEIEVIFLALVDLPPEKQQAFLDKNCRDPALRHAIEKLLHADIDGGSSIALIVQRAAAELLKGE